MLIYVRVFVLMIAIMLGLAKKCIVTTSGGTQSSSTHTQTLSFVTRVMETPQAPEPTEVI